MSQVFSSKNARYDWLLNIGKISILVFFSIIVIANFTPFFDSEPNSYLHGLQTIRITEGSPWESSNILLDETGSWEFVPGSWKKTIHDTAIPKHSPGLAAIGSIFYSIGGLYGLFYLGPIFTILLLVASERIATKLFDKYVGFFTLLFLTTNGYIFTIGRTLLTDNIFALLTIVGFFCLFKFIFEKKNNYLIYASLLFSFSSFIRVNGIYYLPIEIFIVSLFLILNNKKTYNILKYFNGELLQKVKKFSSADIGKIILCIIGPWLIFILFFVIFNTYYFGDPIMTYYTIPDDPGSRSQHGTGSILSIFEFKSEYGEAMKSYSNYVLPYPVYRIELLDFDKIIQERDDPLTSTSLILLQSFVGQNNLGLLTFLVLGIAMIVSFYSRSHMIAIFTFCFAISSMLLFWTASQIAYELSTIAGRFVLPVFPMMSMILGFLIVKFLKIRNFRAEKRTSSIIILSLKIIFIVFLILFFTVAVFNSAPIQLIKNSEFEFNDPTQFISSYPPNLEGLDKNSILVGGNGDKAVAYGFIPLFPLAELNFIRDGYISNDNVNQNSIEMLKELVRSERDLIVEKEVRNVKEYLFRQEMLNKYGLILENVSPSFCKFDLIEENDTKIDSLKVLDGKCYGENQIKS